MIPRLGDAPDAPFPPPAQALQEPDGLLAWGGDLSPGRLLRAYARGIFPWYSEDDPILWWCPQQRCIIKTGAVHVSRRLHRQLQRSAWHVTADLAFGQVVSGCATRAVFHLDHAGNDGSLRANCIAWAFAHSIEVWDQETLIGGLYGVALGRMFFGESMYSARSNASKVVLVELCRVLEHWGFSWMDCQVPNPHLFRMGAERIERAEFLAGVRHRVSQHEEPGPWTRRFSESLEALGGGSAAS